MIQRPSSPAQGLGVGDGGGHVSFGQQHRLRQGSVVRQVAGQRRGKGATRAVGGARALPVRLKHLVFDATVGVGEAQQIGGFVQVPASDYYVGSPQLVQTQRCRLHFIQV